MSITNQVDSADIELKTSESTKKVYTISLAGERLKATEEKWVKLARGQAQVPGFRRGQVPEAILLKQVGPWVKEKTTEEVFQSVVGELVKKENLKLAYHPVVSNLDYQFGEKLVFEITFAVEPVIKLAPYKGLSLKSHKRSVREEDVNSQFEDILGQSTAYLKPKADGKINRDDLWVLLSLKCENLKNPAEPLLSVSEEMISLEEEVLPFGLREALKEASSGAKKEFKVPCDEDCPVSALRGQELKFGLEVHEVKELQKSTGSQPLEEAQRQKLRESIRKALEARYEAREKAILNDQITGELLEANPIDVPEIEVESRVAELLKRAKTVFSLSGHEVTSEHEEELRVKYRIEALNDVRLSYILGAIGKEANIKVEEADFKKRFEAAQNEEEKKKLTQNKESVLYEIFSDKVFSYIANNAKIEVEEV